MKKVLLALALLFPALAAAQCSSTLAASGNYGTAQGASGDAQYLIYMPTPSSCYNGQVILYTHGYVAAGSPPGTWMSQLTLPDGTNLPQLVNQLGFGFAASSYSQDGLAILEGIQDTKALRELVRQSYAVQKFFIAGPSEGGLITTKSVESDPLYAGGLAVCGPIGSFQGQINYVGDARVLFDYFFPGVMGAAWTRKNYTIPADLMNNWPAYETAIRNAVKADPATTQQYLNASNVPIGSSYSNAPDAIVAVLWYSAFGTNDIYTKLGGNPYDNIGRVYSGSKNDAKMNARVARFTPTGTAPQKIPAYETTGVLHQPLVTLHTTADPVIPYWHETEYTTKATNSNSLSELAQLPAYAFGHCNITAWEAELSLFILLIKDAF